MSHGFGISESKYDKDGNAASLWTQNITDKYDKIIQCFIDQYDKYLFPGLKHKNVYVDGSLTLGENIADSAGIVAAYYAYKNRKARLNEPEWRLQGLEQYSDDQIFFLMYDQMMCKDIFPEVLQNRTFDNHPRMETRILGSLLNFPEFSAAYNCPKEKRINPEKKYAL
ncbi:neprilysin-11-like [Pseudomyrmex gracilis]|uniref:neprilysin-11-like n=1 Tax=Pseudomyrmex gracilis TaxID=219809 RepID=UPI000994C8CD|nr:neprilysin-11-like [Pseudomyrmex gracilis]